jgi:threonine aldolase
VKESNKVFIQVQAEDIERKRLKAIADYRGVNMSTVVRAWIRVAYKALPEEAKQ